MRSERAIDQSTSHILLLSPPVHVLETTHTHLPLHSFTVCIHVDSAQVDFNGENGKQEDCCFQKDPLTRQKYQAKREWICNMVKVGFVQEERRFTGEEAALAIGVE